MASHTALVGALGMARQAAKGTAGVTNHYMPVTSLNLNAQQNTQALPPEIGGSYFIRGAYKAGVAGGGDVSFIVRPDTIGQILHMLCGTVSAVTNYTGTSVSNPAVAPTLTAQAGSTSLAAGAWTVAYTWVTAGGETQISPTTSVTITSGQQIQVTALATPPAGVTGVKYYMSISVGSGTLGYTATNTAGQLIILTTAGNGTTPPGSNTSQGSADGSYTHTFSPFAPTANAALPWYTLYKDVAKQWSEQYLDAHLASLRLDVSKQALVMGTASFFALTPSEVAVVSSPTFDNAVAFNTCKATVAITDEAGILTFPADASAPERISLDFTNMLSQDEFTVGSFYPYDSTLLQRAANISYDLVVRSPDLRRAAYQNGGGIGAWSPSIVRTHLNIALVSTQNVASSTRPFSLTIDLPGTDMLMLPIQMNGAQLIRGSLSAQVSLGTSGTDTYSFALTDDVADYTVY